MKKRNARWKQERKARRRQTQRVVNAYGVTKEELWNLCDYLAEYILGRLKAFRAIPKCSYPAKYINNGGPEAFEKDLDAMIEGFELYVKDEYWHVDNPNREEDLEKVNRAPMLFSELIYDLWD